jgi:hypothetical protein
VNFHVGEFDSPSTIFNPAAHTHFRTTGVRQLQVYGLCLCTFPECTSLPLNNNSNQSERARRRKVSEEVNLGETAQEGCECRFQVLLVPPRITYAGLTGVGVLHRVRIEARQDHG